MLSPAEPERTRVSAPRAPNNRVAVGMSAASTPRRNQRNAGAHLDPSPPRNLPRPRSCQHGGQGGKNAFPHPSPALATPFAWPGTHSPTHSGTSIMHSAGTARCTGQAPMPCARHLAIQLATQAGASGQRCAALAAATILRLQHLRHNASDRPPESCTTRERGLCSREENGAKWSTG